MAIAFLDFEASSLSPTSYPIEIGWAVAGAEAAESHLILPHPDWIDWDPAAQGVHGISRSQLFEHGLAGPAVLALMTRSLAGLVVYSDAPAEDGHWLDRLCMACGSPFPSSCKMPAPSSPTWPKPLAGTSAPFNPLSRGNTLVPTEPVRMPPS